MRALLASRRGCLGDLRVDIVVNARRGCARASWSALEADFQRAFASVLKRIES
jgi:hypothetical protein